MTPWEVYKSIGWTGRAMVKTLRANAPRNWLRYWRQKREYVATGTDESIYHTPCINDWSTHTPMDPVYFYQDAWAFERILEFGAEEHVDIGSHHKLVTLLSKVVRTTMVDIRPLELQLESLNFLEGSILSLPFDDGTCRSVSSICVIEHIGLGRYGDPIDDLGSVKAARELVRVLAPDGRLFVSVPVIETDRVFFNAHRAFSEPTVLEMFAPLKLVQKRYIYGKEFGRDRKSGFGTGCYEFARDDAAAESGDAS